MYNVFVSLTNVILGFYERGRYKTDGVILLEGMLGNAEMLEKMVFWPRPELLSMAEEYAEIIPNCRGDVWKWMGIGKESLCT